MAADPSEEPRCGRPQGTCRNARNLPTGSQAAGRIRAGIEDECYQGGDEEIVREIPFHIQLWTKVKRERRTDCWEWHGPIDKDGYGYITKANINIKAHRAAYEDAVGPIQDGKLVCHSCDNRKCCNPDHLWVGSSFDNTLDMLTKVRNKKVIKVNPEKVKDIRNDPRGNAAVARIYKISTSTVRNIRLRKSWKWVE